VFFVVYVLFKEEEEEDEINNMIRKFKEYLFAQKTINQKSSRWYFLRGYYLLFPFSFFTYRC
jgi:hypothetical protein